MLGSAGIGVHPSARDSIPHRGSSRQYSVCACLGAVYGARIDHPPIPLVHILGRSPIIGGSNGAPTGALMARRGTCCGAGIGARNHGAPIAGQWCSS